MSVFRIEKTNHYTVISNYPLQDRNLSLKACALLCKMLCNADTWDYSINGLTAMCKDGKSAISSALKELEQYGYLVRKQHRGKDGRIVDTEYVIYETPELNEEFMQRQKNAVETEPEIFLPEDDPYAENPFLEEAETETVPQTNTNTTSTNQTNTNATNPYPSFNRQNIEQPEPLPTDVMGYEEAYEAVKENIEYDVLLDRYPKEQLDEIVDLAAEVLCTRRATFKIGEDIYPYALVKDRLLRLDASHVEYIVNCMDSVTSDIHNIKQYMLKTLINAPATMQIYYKAKVNHDIHNNI